MIRYMAIMWNDRNEADAATAASLLKRVVEVSDDLRASFECSGMQVLSTVNEKVPAGRCYLSGESGIVLGTLFRAPVVGDEANNARLTALQQHDTRLILDSGSQDLVDRYWGRYVAFLNDPRHDAKLIVRDPMGGLPCFICKLHGVTVAFSCLEDCLRTGMFRFSLNWPHVAGRVALGALPLRETGLKECAELLPGHRVRLSGDKTTLTALWDPVAVAERGTVDDLNVAANQLRAMMQSCTNSWASCYDNVLMDISGGLDSSIVATCLSRTPSAPKVTGVKYRDIYTRPGETRRAQLVADRTGFELVELQMQHPAIAVGRLMTADLTANLELNVGVCEGVDMKNRVARDRGATAIFNGDPGDVLFGASTKAFGFLDYVHRHGIDKRALKVALDVALMTDRSWWSVVAEAISKPLPMFQQDMPAVMMKNRPLAGDRARHILSENRDIYSAPISAADKIPGMSDFSWIFARGMQYYNYFGTALKSTDIDPEPVYILRSQPLVELCLRTPPYIKNAGGRERWIARQAFMNDLPAEITSTFWKDPAPNCAHDRLLRTMASARELLADGMLVEEQLLDRRKLHDALTIGPARRASFPSELQDHLVAEIWVRRMTQALENGRRASARPTAACN